MNLRILDCVVATLFTQGKEQRIRFWGRVVKVDLTTDYNRGRFGYFIYNISENIGSRQKWLSIEFAAANE